jgi:molecular chaperone GrpE
MSDNDIPSGPAEPAPEQNAEAMAGEVPAAQLKEIIAVLQADLDQQQAERMRLIADMDNLRKRTEREKADTAKYAVTKFAQDIVGVVDSFERAASAVPSDAAESNPVLKSFLDGVVIAEKQFLSVLERHGVKRIEAQGQPFNPHMHQAVMEREDATVPHGTVLQVFQPGFVIEDRCLRPAMVVVSNGGPKSPKGSATNPGEAPQEPEVPAQGSSTDPASDEPGQV